MKLLLRFCFAAASVLVVSCFLVLFAGTALFAQQLPVVTIAVGNPANGAVVNGQILALRESAFTPLGGPRVLQSGSVIIRRSGGRMDSALTVGVGIAYRQGARTLLPNTTTATALLPAFPAGAIVTGVPVRQNIAINSFQGDLAPVVSSTIATPRAGIINPVVFPPNVSQVVINVQGRWSDQTAPRNPGLQGIRNAEFTLVDVDGSYTGSVATSVAIVQLDDPQNVPPIPVQCLDQRFLLPGFSDLIELESPQFRIDGLPGSFMYDDNYDPITYTALFNPRFISVQIRQSDDRFQGRPSLFYRIQSATIATIYLSADDGRGGISYMRFLGGVTTATAGLPATECSISAAELQRIATSVQTAPAAPLEYSLSPNPASEHTTLHYTLPQAAAVRVELYAITGNRVAVLEEGWREAGTQRTVIDTSPFAAGVYVLRVLTPNGAQTGYNSRMLHVVR